MAAATSSNKDYSSTPLPRKLGIRDGSRVGLVDAPAGFAETIGIDPRSRGPLDVAILFATRRGQLVRRFPGLQRRLATDGGLWVAWPKHSARLGTDLDFGAVQSFGLERGLVDNKSCSIDEVWQGLRFVIRVADRAR